MTRLDGDMVTAVLCSHYAPSKILPKHISNSHLVVVGEEGVTTEKRTKLRSTGRGKGGVKLEHCLSQFYQGLALNIAFS